MFCEAEAVCEPNNVGVHRDPFVFSEGVPKNNVGGFACYAWECYEFLHGIGDFVAVLFDDARYCRDDVFGFVAVKTG